MPDQKHLEEDVYRISDIIRSAHALIIAIGQNEKDSATPTNQTLLQRWGSRMWTYPEVLLSPGDGIKVYSRGGK